MMAIIYHAYLHPQTVKVLIASGSYKYKSKIWINRLASSRKKTKFLGTDYVVNKYLIDSCNKFV